MSKDADEQQDVITILGSIIEDNSLTPYGKLKLMKLLVSKFDYITQKVSTKE